MATKNKTNFEIDNSRTVRDLDPPLTIRHQEHKEWCLANNSNEK